ncbi:hypothetical protein DXG01_011606, partial [Tephrocybe rancida]
ANMNQYGPLMPSQGPVEGYVFSPTAHTHGRQTESYPGMNLSQMSANFYASPHTTNLNSGWAPTAIPTGGKTITISASEFSEIKNTLTAMKNAQEQQQCQLDEQCESAQQKTRKSVKEKNLPLTTLLKSLMKEFVGIDSERKSENGILTTGLYLEPLPNGTPSHIITTGTGSEVTLWNPEWKNGPRTGVNKLYIEAVMDQLRQREKDHPSVGTPYNLLTNTVLWPYAAQYFKTMRQNYKSQTDDQARAKKNAHNGETKLRNRKKQKADMLRKQIDKFEKKYGAEEMAGLREIVHSEWMSSEHSDCGDASPDKYADHHAKQLGGGMTRGLELRKPEWRSSELCRIYFSLQKMSCDGGAATETEGARQNSVCLLRYRGLPANNNEKAPPMAKGQQPI